MKNNPQNKKLAPGSSETKPALTVSENKENKREHLAYFPELIDVVDQKGEPAFLLKLKGKLKVTKTFSVDGKEVCPPPVEYIQWSLPQAEKVLTMARTWTDADNQKLWNDLVSYLKSISQLPEESYYHLLAAWVIHTYRQEDTEYSPVISFFAVPERGKSRTGKGLIYVAYRGIHLSSLREGFVFRMAESMHASMFFDLTDAAGTARRADANDILLNRYEKGGRIPRVNNPDRGPFRDTTFYQVFGPTIIATNQPLDSVLGTRAIHITMPDSTKSFDSLVKPENGRELRERLTVLRAHYHNQSLPDIPKPAGGRLGDILRPLIQITAVISPENCEQILALTKNLEAQKVSDKAESAEGRLILTLVKLETFVVGGIISIKDITDEYNVGRPERFHKSPASIGRMLKALGFNTGAHRSRMADGSAALQWEEILLRRLKDSYGLSDSSEASDPSVKAGGSEGTDIIHTEDGPIDLNSLNI